VLVAASLQSVDRSLERAAAVHGARPWRVFTQVTLPAIAPGLAAAAFFAFLHSFDELVLSMFLAGSTMSTLPLRLWADVNYQLNPVLAVVSTLEVVLVIVGISFARRTLAGRS
jgi:putative spermidine/putrescine transport system permease protein